MPLGTYKKIEKISTVVQRMRANCLTGSFTDGDSGKKTIDSEMRGMIVYSEELIGMIPPIKTYDQLVTALKQGQKPIPKEEEIDEIVKSLASFCKDWVSIYFIPFIPVNSMGKKAIDKKIVAPRCLTQSFIKSGSLWGKSESGTGFFDYSKSLLRNQTSLSDVITVMRFDNTHKAPGGTDCKGVQFSFELPNSENLVVTHNGETESEIELFNEVQEWLKQFEEYSIDKLQSVFTINPGFLEQLMRLESKDDMSLEFLTPERRIQAASYLIANSISSITKVAFAPSQVLPMIEPALMIDEELALLPSSLPDELEVNEIKIDSSNYDDPEQVITTSNKKKEK